MSRTKQAEMDMIHGSIWNKIPQFALPIAATAILGQLFNASDLAVVGNFTGEARNACVAAVSSNSAIVSLVVNFFVGIGLGANVVIANALGRDDRDMVEKTVHTAILLSVLGGILMAAFGEAIAHSLLSSLNVPEDVFDMALTALALTVAMATPSTVIFSANTKNRFSNTFSTPEKARASRGVFVSPTLRKIAASKL